MEKGVWRTIGGRRVFIKDGEDLATAMKKSGKFKSVKKNKQNNANFNDMAHELHGYVESNFKDVSEDLQNAIANDTLDNYLEKRAGMSKEEIKNFKDKYNDYLNKGNYKVSKEVSDLQEETKNMSEDERYNLAISKLKNEDNLSRDEKHFYNRTKMEYEREKKWENIDQDINNYYKNNGNKEEKQFIKELSEKYNISEFNIKEEIKSIVKDGDIKYPNWIYEMSSNEPQYMYKNRLQDLAFEKEKETGYKIFSINGQWKYMEEGNANSIKNIDAKDTKELAQKIYDLPKNSNSVYFKAYNEYKKEHPNSKISFEDFKKMQK